jgi:hypothetical protein
MGMFSNFRRASAAPMPVVLGGIAGGGDVAAELARIREPMWEQTMLERALKAPVLILLVVALLSVSGSRRVMAQADIVAELAALTKGHVYKGIVYRRETIRKVHFERSQGLLVLELDDADETDPSTAVIPLREVGQGEAEFDGSWRAIVFGCKTSNCITLTRREAFSRVLEKLSRGPAAKLVGAKPERQILFGCKPDRCAAISRAVVALMNAGSGAGAGPTGPSRQAWVKMEQDGTIVVQQFPDSVLEPTQLKYPRSHPRYDEVLRHVGPITPGDDSRPRLIPPLPY